MMAFTVLKVVLFIGLLLLFRANALDKESEENENEEEEGQIIKGQNETESSFVEYFVHKVSGFHFAKEEEEEEKSKQLLKKPPRAPYLDTWKWKRGWKKYPLYIIILGG